MQLRRTALSLLVTTLAWFLTITVQAGPPQTELQAGAGASPARVDLANLQQNDSPNLHDFFPAEAELPAPWIFDPGVYTPAAHMNVKAKLMGGQWDSVRLRDTDLTKAIHIHIGLFPTEAEAIKYASPDTYIFRTDAYMETGQTFSELLQMPNSQYSLTGGSPYGDGGFSGGYQHQQFQPFQVFRVGRVLFHTDASDPSCEGIVEQLLVDKARRLLGQSASSPPTDTPDPNVSGDQTPTITDTPPGTPPIVLKASLGGQGAVTQSVANPTNLASITLSGTVSAPDGAGIGGVRVEVVSGGDPVSATSNPDGSYSLTVNVPGGQGGGAHPGVNFTLQMGDLRIARIVLLQAIEGGQLVSYRDVGVRVFLTWGLDTPAEVQVSLAVDGQSLPPVKGVAQKSYTQQDINRAMDAVNLVIPKDRFPSWGDSSHTLTAEVSLLSPGLVDLDPANNTADPLTFSLQNSRALSILYVSLDPAIGKASLVSFAAQAHNYLDKVYPVPYSWGFVGTSRVSHYLVSPYVGFMKSLDADDLPFNMGDIGIVEGGLEVGKSFSYKAAIVAVEKARKLYNAQRCTDAQGGRISPCPDEVALQAVGVYPDGAFGASKDGFAYADQRNTWRAAANSQAKPQNVAHELGHLFGFGEEYSATSFGVPVTGSTWDGLRFRTADGSCINIMGNVGLACAWINAQTWNTLLGNSLGYSTSGMGGSASLGLVAPRFAPLPAEVESPALLVEGVVTSAGAGFVAQVTPIQRYLQPQETGGNYRLQAWDGNGNLVGGVQFNGLFFDLESNPVSASPFLVVLPLANPAQVAKITLETAGGSAIGDLARSPSAPQVSFDPLPAAINEPLPISWQASDPDGDPLHASLYYSHNGGQSWQILALDIPETSFTLDPSELPGGTAFLKVVLSDGFNTAESVSTPVTLPDQTPFITILTPWGVEFEPSEGVTLQAAVYDLEDGLLAPEMLQWSDADGNPLGSGPALHVDLPSGQHSVVLTAGDSSGHTSTVQVGVTVLPEPGDSGGTLDGLLPAFDWAGNWVVILAAGACSLGLAAVVAGGLSVFVRNRRKSAAAQIQVQTAGQVQDRQGRWWAQDPHSGTWSIWNGRAWQVAPGAVPNLAPDQISSHPAARYSSPAAAPGRSSCLLTLAAALVLGLLAVGAISLVALNFIPGYQVHMAQGDFSQILKKGGGGLLVAVVGFFLLNGGFKSILTRRAVVTDEWGHRREKRGCGAILNGLGQLLIGLLFWTGGLGLLTLTFYQDVLPWLGF